MTNDKNIKSKFIGGIIIEKKYWIWFSMLKIENRIKHELLKMYGNPKNIWNLHKDVIKNFKYGCSNELRNDCYKTNLNKVMEYMKSKNIKVITIDDEEYPDNLKAIDFPPIVLYAIGNVELLKQKSIAVIGCRLCSDYGKNTAKVVANILSKNKVVVVSGMARGIDKYAHLGALEECNSTIAVLGSGVDYVYPYENKKIYENIIARDGLIISEYPVGSVPDAKNFPERNRIISGLSEGIVVIEAKEHSGSFITVEYALSQGKDVFAVPGNINSVNSTGTNRLIYEGAIPIININMVSEIAKNIKK